MRLRPLCYLSTVLLASGLLSCADRTPFDLSQGPAAARTEHALFVAGPTIVITEIMANPSAVYDSDGEWFEVHNRSEAAVDLQGWNIASNNDAPHAIAANVVIPAGGYAVLARTGDPATNGGVTATYVYGDGALNLANSSDWLALRDASGTSADSVAWKSSATAGASRALIDPASDNTDVDADAWTTSTTPFGDGDQGSPGEPNDVSPPPSGEPGEVARITLAVSGAPELPAGYTKPVFPTARDAVGTIISPPPVYTWTSSDPAVATVDTLGYVTGVAPGTAAIRAAAPNGILGEIRFTVIPGDASTSAVYRDHVEFGVPTDGTPADEYLLEKTQYVLSYNEQRGGPNWASWNLNATHFGTAGRCNCFTANPQLPETMDRVVDFDYRGSGYNRGHVVQSFNRTTTDQENASTFLMTNILPQAAENNQGPWLAFESYLNDLARQQGKEIYVIAGGEYDPNPETLKGEGKIAVPAFTWKIAVVMEGGEGLCDVRSANDLEVVAVRMPNDTVSARGIRDNPWRMYETTVDKIEAATEYDFLAELPDAVEQGVESGVSGLVAEVNARRIQL